MLVIVLPGTIQKLRRYPLKERKGRYAWQSNCAYEETEQIVVQSENKGEKILMSKKNYIEENSAIRLSQLCIYPMGSSIWNGERQSKEEDKWCCQVVQDETQVHIPDSISVSSLYCTPEEPLWSHHGNGASYFSVKNTQGPVLPHEEDSALLQRDPQRHHHNQLKKQAE